MCHGYFRRVCPPLKCGTCALDKRHAGPEFAKAETAGPSQDCRVMLCNLETTHYADTVSRLAHNYQILRMPFAISRLYTCNLKIVHFIDLKIVHYIDCAEHHICERQ